jgi:hypothetical protein
VTTTRCDQAPHPAPPHLYEILPPVANTPEVEAALAAATAGCDACMKRHRLRAGAFAILPHQSISLFLMYAVIVLNAHNRPPGATGEEVVKNLAPETFKLLSGPTRRVMSSIHVEEVTAPNGALTGIWDRDAVAALVEGISSQDRHCVWNDTLGLLTGIVHGEGRARAEAGE